MIKGQRSSTYMQDRVEQRIFIYRNCFTGAVSGGDVHTVGFCEWLMKLHQEMNTTLIYSLGDGQETYYSDTHKANRLKYRCPQIKATSLLYFLRAVFGTIRVRIPWATGKNILIASAHFLPDVLPVALKGRSAPRVVRAVYIHHVIQDMPRPKNLNTSLANIQEKICFWIIKRKFNKIIVVNQIVADRLRELGFDRQEILLSSNFVNSFKTQDRAFDERNISIIFCGRLMPQKGINDFIDACDSLYKSNPNFRAAVVGTGPEYERLRKLISSKSLPIRLTGFISDEQKFELLSQARLFVFPSVEEGWGIAVAEAIATGTPVIAYNLPVYKSIFKRNIHTVTLRDKEGLVDLSKKMLSEFESNPDKFAKESAKISLFAKRFSIESVSQSEFMFLMKGVEA